jgi:hypothetical protein
MQDIDLLLKSINELEFLVAYQKHLITTSKCKCDTFMDSLRELYRLYTNSKYITNTLKNGINKLYKENKSLKKQLFDKHEIIKTIAVDAEITAARLNERRLHEQQQQQQYQSQPNLIPSSTSSSSTTVSPHLILKPTVIQQSTTTTTPSVPFNYLYNPIRILKPIATSSVKSSPNIDAHYFKQSTTTETTSSSYSSTSQYSSITTKQNSNSYLYSQIGSFKKVNYEVDAKFLIIFAPFVCIDHHLINI